MVKFSILLPVYNVEKYLPECFASIENQSFDDYEVIVVDDGSTDGSPMLCDAFAEKHPNKVSIIHQQNQGLIAARRAAIEKAQGEFCIFMDSDDFVEPELLKVINDYTKKSEDIDIVLYLLQYYANGQKISSQKKIAENATIWSGERKKELYELLITCGAIDSLCTKAMRTEIVRKDPIDYSLYYDRNMSEDVLQSLYPLTFAKKIIYADYPLYNYRYNNVSISRNFTAGTIEKKNSSHVFKEIHKLLPLWNMGEEIAKRVDARWFSDVMYIFLKSCQAAKSKKDWNEIFTANWNEMLPKIDIQTFAEYANPIFLKIYFNYINGRFYKIRFYFFKQRIYKKIRALKRRVR